MEDRGDYIVKAVNSYGSKEESAKLIVECKFLSQGHVVVMYDQI